MSFSLVVQFHCTMFHTTLFPGPLGKFLGNKVVFHGHSSLSEMMIIITITTNNNSNNNNNNDNDNIRMIIILKTN